MWKYAPKVYVTMWASFIEQFPLLLTGLWFCEFSLPLTCPEMFVGWGGGAGFRKIWGCWVTSLKTHQLWPICKLVCGHFGWFALLCLFIFLPCFSWILSDWFFGGVILHHPAYAPAFYYVFNCSKNDLPLSFLSLFSS